MKKFFVIIAVLALTLVSSFAMAAEVTMDGSVEFLMRSFSNTNDWNNSVTGAGDYQSTYERVRLGMNAKGEGVKARIQIDTDWDQWADSPTGLTTGATTTAAPNPGFDTRTNGTFSIREGWLDFGLGFGTAHVKVGRQFLQLGNGWFLRSAKHGSDAWLVGMPGKNTVAFVNIKASENNSTLADDTDAYALLDVFKIDDKNTVGANISRANDRRGTWTANALTGPGPLKTELTNYEVHYAGKVGPVNLQAQIDMQSGKITFPTDKVDLSGSQWVLQANVPIDALTVNATLASGSGDKVGTTNKVERYLNFLDTDPRFTMVYEYVMRTAATTGGTGFPAGAYTKDKNTGFSNTQVIGLGAGYKINKMFTVNFDAWMLSANEKVALNGNATASDKLGNEFDLKLTANIAEGLSWYVNYGLFKTGDAYKNAAGIADDATAIQSVLSYKF